MQSPRSTMRLWHDTAAGLLPGRHGAHANEATAAEEGMPDMHCNEPSPASRPRSCTANVWEPSQNGQLTSTMLQLPHSTLMRGEISRPRKMLPLG